MTTSRAHAATGHASRYLQQLCKHWSHRFAVEFDDRSGRIAFGDGQVVTLSASEAGLDVQIADATAEGLDRLEGVVADHLGRFAFREELVFDWKRDGAGQATD